MGFVAVVLLELLLLVGLVVVVGLVTVVVGLVVVVLVVVGVELLVELLLVLWQSLAASSLTVAAPCPRFCTSVVLIVDGRSAT
ncbi:MAG TPA: hypothetical protein VGH45_12245 [Solirubrobacteraceae bacterium]